MVDDVNDMKISYPVHGSPDRYDINEVVESPDATNLNSPKDGDEKKPVKCKTGRNIFNPDWDIRYVQGYKDKIGYINKLLKEHVNNKGEEKYGRNAENLIGQSPPQKTQTVVDWDTDTFKYNIRYNEDYNDFRYEDPLLGSFDVELDVLNSPLFKKMGNDSKTYIQKYLEDYYGDIPELKSRMYIYNEFVNTLFRIFDGEFEDKRRNKNKSYYINSISGMDKLNAKIVKYKEDKITIELQEDVSMISMYLAELFNNLVYSYKDQKHIIPENLVRFNMKIKVSDIRNFKNSPKSYSIYTLYDCNFNFVDSKNFGSDLRAAGIQQALPVVATVPLEIFYKSISREFFSPLVNKAPLLLNNKRKTPYFNSENHKQSQGTTFIGNYKNDEDFDEEISVIEKAKLVETSSTDITTTPVVAPYPEMYEENKTDLLVGEYKNIWRAGHEISDAGGVWSNNLNRRGEMFYTLEKEISEQFGGIVRSVTTGWIDRTNWHDRNLSIVGDLLKGQTIEQVLTDRAQRLIRDAGRKISDGIYGDGNNLGNVNATPNWTRDDNPRYPMNLGIITYDSVIGPSSPLAGDVIDQTSTYHYITPLNPVVPFSPPYNIDDENITGS